MKEGVFLLVVIRSRWGYFVPSWRKFRALNCCNVLEERYHLGRMPKATCRGRWELLWIGFFVWEELWFGPKQVCAHGHIRMESWNQAYSRKWAEEIKARDTYVRRIPLVKDLKFYLQELQISMRDTWELCGFENGRFFSPLFSKLQSVGTVPSTFSTPMRKNNPPSTEIPKRSCCEKSLRLNPALLCVACLRQVPPHPSTLLQI